MRTDKFSQLYTVVVGAAISGLPYSIYVLVFQAKLSLVSAILLWLLTTIVIVEDWWVTTEIFEAFPTNSIVVMTAGFLYMMGILALPAILIGSIHGPETALNYYVWDFVALSALDVVFCLSYIATLKEKKARYSFTSFILMDGLVAAFYVFWLRFISSDAGMTFDRKVLWLCGLYLAELVFEIAFDGVSRKKFEAIPVAAG